MMRLLLALIVFVFAAPAHADPQGALANESGQKFETQITDLLIARNFKIEKSAGDSKDRIAIRQPPYTTVYGNPGRCDFMLHAPELTDDVWIETKNMESAGSVDEKLPHTFLNALSANPGKHVIIIVDGDGWRPGALEWLRTAAKDDRWKSFANDTDKRVEIMSPDEFQNWLNKTFP